MKEQQDVKRGASFSANGVDEESDAERLCAKHGISKEVSDKLHASHPRLWVLESLPIIFRAATKAEWSRFAQKAESKDKLGAIDELASCVIVYPDRAAAFAMLEEYPLIGGEIVADLSEAARAKQVEHSKKF